MLFTTGCAVKYPVPEVKEGRFNFSVTYLINGEEKNYSGVYVCKYKGIHVTLVGSSRMWDGYIDGTDNYGLIEIQKTNDDGVIYIDFGFYPQYFMSDIEYNNQIPQPYLLVSYTNEETGEMSWFGDEEEIVKKYGVKIISYDYDEPIQNSFENKWSFGYFEPEIN